MIKFKYQELSQDRTRQPIRLVRLHPGKRDQPIVVTLFEAALADKPKYEAISYCWADKSSLKAIACNEAPLLITKSLHQALVRFRYTARSRILWADALCIDQHNLAEKNIQVAMMGQVYKSCIRVLIWLGYQSGRDNDDRFPIPVTNHTILRIMWSRVKYVTANETRDWYALDRLSLQTYNLPSPWDAKSPWYREVAQLLCIPYQPWFERLWIIQELALAPQAILHFGILEVPWGDFFTAWEYLIIGLVMDKYPIFHWNPEIHGRSPRGLQSSSLVLDDDRRTERLALKLNDTRRMMQTVAFGQVGLQNLSLATLLYMHQTARSEDPRDKIFGLLSILSGRERDQLNIEVNYIDTRTLDVYLDATVKILKLDQDLDIINAAIPTDSDWPSWVPDWTIQIPSMLSFTKNYHATNETRYAPEPSSDPARLSLKGQFLGQIYATGTEYVRRSKTMWVQPTPWGPLLLIWRITRDLWGGEWALLDWYLLVLSHIELLERRARLRYVDFPTVFWQTVVMYTVDDPPVYTPQLDIYKPVQVLQRILDKVGWMWLSLLKTTVFRATLCFLLIVTKPKKGQLWIPQCSNRRKVVVTTDGFLGIASSGVTTGDVIALLEGAKVPLVLRRKGEDYRIVGDCYVHGAMYGEEFRGRQSKTIWIV